MAQTGRDRSGKFVKGHTHGVGFGRPSRKVEEDYIRAFAQAVTTSDWKAIIRKAVANAKKGDDRAREWLSNYLCGKPILREGIGAGNPGDNPYLAASDDELRNIAKQITKRPKSRIPEEPAEDSDEQG